MILRVEDTDPERSRPEYEKAILEDLRWLGLDWDEGPDVGGPRSPYRQSERGEIYRDHARRLQDEGKVYPCYCSREELEEKGRRAVEEGRTPVYDGTCRDLSEAERRQREREGRKPALRFRVQEEEIVFRDLLHGWVRFPAGVIGDFIICRSDGRAGFNFSVVVDDAVMGITHVIRGEDHLTNTARHLLLFRALGYQPPVFAHHSLLLGPDGAKMSKRHGAVSVREYRAMGYLPEALVNYLALLSWSPPEGKEVLTPRELVKLFDLESLSTSPAVFDSDRLKWLNGRHIRSLNPGELARRARDYAPRWRDHPHFSLMVESVTDNLSTLGELPDYLSVYDRLEEPGDREEAWLKGETSRKVLEKAREILAAVREGDLEDARERMGRLKHGFLEKGLKAREILMPIRVALTGRDKGPALPYLVAVLGGKECSSRLDRALSRR